MEIKVFKPTELLKAKYTKRTGSPGNYKYEYGEPKGKAKPTSDIWFSSSMLTKLQRDYAHVTKMDPEGATHNKMMAMINRMPLDNVRQLAGAKISFLSTMAQARIQKEDPRIKEFDARISEAEDYIKMAKKQKNQKLYDELDASIYKLSMQRADIAMGRM